MKQLDAYVYVQPWKLIVRSNLMQGKKLQQWAAFAKDNKISAENTWHREHLYRL